MAKTKSPAMRLEGENYNDHCDAGRRIDVTVIVVSFNTREMTVECLRSIIAETHTASFEVIVVDNNSHDGSPEAIRREFPQFTLVALKENIGFARANNIAAARACGRRILLLNPDTLVLDGAIDRLMRFADETPSYQVWGGRTVYSDRTLNPKSCWRRITLWSLACSTLGLSRLFPNSAILNFEAYGGWERDTVRHVDIVTGCFFLIDRQLWQRLGGFDPAFFMYGEEADLCHRARQLGARPAITPTATIVHYVGASDTIFLEKRVKVLKGRMTLIRKHFNPLRYRIARVLQLSVPLTRWLGYRLLAVFLSNRSDLDRLADDWQAIWRRRREWKSRIRHKYSIARISPADGALLNGLRALREISFGCEFVILKLVNVDPKD